LQEISDPTQILQEDRLVKLNTLISEFLTTHTVFWQDVIVMMDNLNDTARILSEK
jgi:hypothetical protein